MVGLTLVNVTFQPLRPWDLKLREGPSVRLQSATTSLETLAAHPLFGSGLGSSPGRRGSLAFDAHLTPLNVAATLGLPALAGLGSRSSACGARARGRPTSALWGMLAGLALDGSARTSRTSGTSGSRSGSRTRTSPGRGAPHEASRGAPAPALALAAAASGRAGAWAACPRPACRASTGARPGLSHARPRRLEGLLRRPGPDRDGRVRSNGDGRADYIAHYDENRQIREIEVDEDHDSWVDRFEYYDAAGMLEKVGRCPAPTGSRRRVDLPCARRAASRVEYDDDGDGKPERAEVMKDGALVADRDSTPTATGASTAAGLGQRTARERGDRHERRRRRRPPAGVRAPGAPAAGRAPGEVRGARARGGLVRVPVRVRLAVAPLLAGAVHEPVFIPLLAGWPRRGARRGVHPRGARPGLPGLRLRARRCSRSCWSSSCRCRRRCCASEPRLVRVPRQRAARAPFVAWGPISVSPADTWRGLAFLAAFLLLAIAVLQVGEGRWRRRLLRTIVSIGLALTVIALLQAVSPEPRRIYGVWQPRWDWAVFGPYVNRNHFAGYMVMVSALAVGFALEALSRLRAAWVDRRQGWLALGDAEGLAFVRAAALVVASWPASSRRPRGAASRASRRDVGVLLLILFGARYRRRAAGRRDGAPPSLLLVALGRRWIGLGGVISAFEVRGVRGSRLDLWRDSCDRPALPGFGAAGTPSPGRMPGTRRSGRRSGSARRKTTTCRRCSTAGSWAWRWWSACWPSFARCARAGPLLGGRARAASARSWPRVHEPSTSTARSRPTRRPESPSRRSCPPPCRVNWVMGGLDTESEAAHRMTVRGVSASSLRTAPQGSVMADKKTASLTVLGGRCRHAVRAAGERDAHDRLLAESSLYLDLLAVSLYHARVVIDAGRVSVHAAAVALGGTPTQQRDRA